MKLPVFRYDYNSYPLLRSKLKNKITKGNCRLAVQLYFYKFHNLYLPPYKILCPYSYKKTGRFVVKEKDMTPNFLSLLKIADVIFAEKYRNRNKKIIYKPKKSYRTIDDWIMYFHTAVYIGNASIYHATAIEGKTCLWPLKKFEEYYEVVAVKRFLNS